MAALNQPDFHPTYFWPLSYGNLFPGAVLSGVVGVGLYPPCQADSSQRVFDNRLYNLIADI
jgi:hypothetical protein